MPERPDNSDPTDQRFEAWIGRKALRYLFSMNNSEPTDQRFEATGKPEEELQRLKIELNEAREKAAYYESFSSETIAVLDKRIRQLVSELETTQKEPAGLKESAAGTAASPEAANRNLGVVEPKVNATPVKEEELQRLKIELNEAREKADHSESFSSDTIAVLDKRNRQLASELERTQKELTDLKEGAAATRTSTEAEIRNPRVAQTRPYISLVRQEPADGVNESISATGKERERYVAASTGVEASAEPAPISRFRQELAEETVNVDTTDNTPGTAPTLETVGAPLAPDQPVFASQDEEVQLVVAPFSSFGAINKFTSAVRSLPGVSRVTIRRFQKSSLQVSVEYTGIGPLTLRLADLREFRLRVTSATRDRIEAMLEAPDERGQGAASGGA